MNQKSFTEKVSKWDVHRDFDMLWNNPGNPEGHMHAQGSAQVKSSAHAKESLEKVPSSHIWLILRLYKQDAKTKAEA